MDLVDLNKKVVMQAYWFIVEILMDLVDLNVNTDSIV